MANLKQLRLRIRTAKNIQQITRAMKLVAAARLRKSHEKTIEARPYSESLQDLVFSLLNGSNIDQEVASHPLLSLPPSLAKSKNYGLILITSDRGLAGAYNTSLIRKASEFMSKQEGTPFLFSIGKKGAQFFGKRGYTIVYEKSLLSSGAKFEDAVELSRVAQEMMNSKQLHAIYLAYSKFYSPIKQVPDVVKLLPVSLPQHYSHPEAPHNYLFEPDPKQILNTILPRYLLALIYQTLLESNASEHGARMTAMTSATDNATKVIDHLTLIANRERQAGITTEILEVVSGAEALSRI